MTSRKSLLVSLALLVIAPVTLVALLATGLLISEYVTQSRAEFGDFGLLSLVVPAIVVVAWFGLVTLWRLTFHFRRSDSAPDARTRYLLGVLCACAVSTLLAWAFGSAGTPGPAIVAALPLLAALPLGGLLLAAKPKA